MRISTALIPALVLSMFILIPGTHAGEVDGLIVKQSPHSAAATLDKLENIMKSKGITIFARVNHAAGAAKVDLDLAPTELLIFGNPKLGTPLMQKSRTTGIDLPMKALAWEENGQTFLAYNDPAYLKDRHGADVAPVLKKIAGALDNLTNAAIKP